MPERPTIKKFIIKQRKKRKYTKRATTNNSLPSTKPLSFGLIPSFLFFFFFFWSIFSLLQSTTPETFWAILHAFAVASQAGTETLKNLDFTTQSLIDILTALDMNITTFFVFITNQAYILLESIVSFMFMALNTIRTTFDMVGTFLTTIAISVIDELIYGVHSFIAFCNLLLMSITHGLISIYTLMTTITITVLTTLAIALITTIHTILNFLTGFGILCFNAAQWILTGCLHLLQTIAQTIASFFTTLWHGIIWPFQQAAHELQKLQPMWDIIEKGITNGVDTLRNGPETFKKILEN